MRQLRHLLAEPREPVFADRRPFKCRVAAAILSPREQLVVRYPFITYSTLLHFPPPFFLLHTRPVIFPPLEFSRCHFFAARQIPNSFISKKMKSAPPGEGDKTESGAEECRDVEHCVCDDECEKSDDFQTRAC